MATFWLNAADWRHGAGDFADDGNKQKTAEEKGRPTIL